MYMYNIVYVYIVMVRPLNNRTKAQLGYNTKYIITPSEMTDILYSYQTVVWSSKHTVDRTLDSNADTPAKLQSRRTSLGKQVEHHRKIPAKSTCFQKRPLFVSEKAVIIKFKQSPSLYMNSIKQVTELGIEFQSYGQSFEKAWRINAVIRLNKCVYPLFEYNKRWYNRWTRSIRIRYFF